jgi:hypothetical protein
MSDPTPFISTQDLSDYIGRDVTADNGAVIAIDAACQIVRGIAGQTFTELTETISLDGTGTDCLLLPELPVNAAGTVTESGEPLVQGVDYVLANQRKLIRTAGTSWNVNVIGDAAHWPQGRQNIVVTYDHGYAGGTVPSDVRMVALQVASRIAIQGIAQQETVATEAITYSSPAMDLTPGERLILSKYRAY